MSDGFTKEQKVPVFGMLAFATADYRGLPHFTQMRQAPAVIGACPACNIVSLYVKGLDTTVYPGAFRWLPRDHNLREHWAASFPQAKEPVNMGRPTAKTDELNRALAEAVEEEEADPEDAGCYPLGHLAAKLDIDTGTAWINDPMHLFANAGKCEPPFTF